MASESLSLLLRFRKSYSLFGSLYKSGCISSSQQLPFNSIKGRKMSTSDDSDIGPNHLKLLERNPKRLKRIKFLAQLFKNNGFELKIAGGAVRDLVNKIEPVDIDFATDALPQDTLSLVQKHEDLLRVIVTQSGMKHGTVAVKFKEVDDLDYRKRLRLDTAVKADVSKPGSEPVYDDESPFEITTLRCDEVTDGRHAQVKFINDWKVDAERRDLTINSMFLNLDDGLLVDYFGGQQDCKDRVIRFVGDPVRRIQEDYLRILRFIRFWARISQQPPADDQLAAISANLDGLLQISGERIWQELKKIFISPEVSRVFKLMMDINLFKYIGIQIPDKLDGLNYSKTILSEIDDIEKNVKSFMDFLKEADGDSKSKKAKQMKDLIPLIVFSVCLRTEQSCFEAHKRLKFSNLERDTLLTIIASRSEDMSLAAMKRLLALAPEPMRPNIMLRLKALLVLKGRIEIIQQLEQWAIPKFPLSGRDVSTAMMNRKLHFSKTKLILEEAKMRWAEDDYKTDAEKLKVIIEEIADGMATK